MVGAGSLMMLIGMFFASYCKSWNSFLFFYAVLYPIGIGIVYYVPIVTCWEWFPERKGLITGLIVGGFGFGAFIFGFLTTAIANPKDEKADNKKKLFSKEVADRAPSMLRICVICWAVLSIIAVSLISRKP